jgi:hypothetical protein
MLVVKATRIRGYGLYKLDFLVVFAMGKAFSELALCFFFLHYSKAQSIGDNGVQQYPDIGWYCSYYVQQRYEEAWFAPTTLPSCYQCFGYVGDNSRFNPTYVAGYTTTCPWSCTSSFCSSIYSGKINSQPPPNQYMYSLDCNAGCVRKTPCQAIENGYFTGRGGTASDTCPFECNAGYLKQGYSCVGTCSEGFYQLNGYCTECQKCAANGLYKSGCSGSSAGDCIPCSNTN